MQTTYNTLLSAAFAGMIADEGNRDVLSRLNDVVVPFGVAVARGATPDSSVKLPAASGDVSALVGVAISSQSVESQRDGSSPNYSVPSVVPVLHRGRVWVSVEEAVTPASPVYVRYASGAGGTQLGAFRASADTTTAAQWTGARYLTSASAGGMAILEVIGT